MVYSTFDSDLQDSTTNHSEIMAFLDTYFTDKPNEKTILFFQKIINKNPSALEKISLKLKKNSNQLKTHLEVKHIEIAAAALSMQMEMPAKIEDAIDEYLAAKPAHFLDKILSTLKTNWLINPLYNSCLADNVFHLISQLKLLNNETPRDLFLKAIIKLMLNLVEQERYAENEYMAERVGEWLINILELPTSSPLKKLIHFMANRLMILSALIIPGPTRAMSLSELFFIFEDVATQSHISVVHSSNKQFVHSLNIIMLMACVCKKKPTAFYDLINLQQYDLSYSTLPRLKTYFQRVLIFEIYFKQAQFHEYYIKNNGSDVISQQAFLTSLITILNQKLNSKYRPEKMNKLKQFITLCKKQYSICSDNKKFIGWFNHTFEQYEVDTQMESILWSSMEEFATTSHSQIGSLVFVANKLVSMGLLPRAASVATTGSFQPLISPEVAMTDAKNLKFLASFYNNIDKLQQKLLIKEILLALVLHATSISNRKAKYILRKRKKQTSITINMRSRMSKTALYSNQFFKHSNHSIEKYHIPYEKKDETFNVSQDKVNTEMG